MVSVMVFTMPGMKVMKNRSALVLLLFAIVTNNNIDWARPADKSRTVS
jgi:hypothetical protein